jgi:saccharopine dehydrogenase-like NADP-dependent oxidoreductase
MKIIVLGAGMMGRAITYDLCKYSNFESITITDKDKKNLHITKEFLEYSDVNYDILNIEKINVVKKYFEKNDIVISAVPYIFNNSLTKIAIETQTHLLDLGG